MDTPRPRSAFWRRNTIWPILSGSLIGLLLIGYYVFSLDIVSYAAWTALVLLVLTLAPNNLFKLFPTFAPELMNRLTRYRRDFGISTGLIILLHVDFALLIYGGVNLLAPTSHTISNYFSFSWSREILPAWLSLFVIILMLLTSNLYAQQKLKTGWKLLHSFIWFITPLLLTHSLLASSLYRADPSSQALLAFGFLILLALVGGLIYGRRHQYSWISIRPVSWVLIAGIISLIYVFATLPR